MKELTRSNCIIYLSIFIYAILLVLPNLFRLNSTFSSLFAFTSTYIHKSFFASMTYLKNYFHSVSESYLVFKVFLLMFIIIILFFSCCKLILILLNNRRFEMLRFNAVTNDVMYLFYLLTFMGKLPLKY